jgi:uncharacterized membrane protein YgaE (UPF0421/DUF939 family)
MLQSQLPKRKSDGTEDTSNPFSKGINPLTQLKSMQMQMGMSPVPATLPHALSMVAVDQAKQRAKDGADKDKMLVALLEEVLKGYQNELECDEESKQEPADDITVSQNSIWSKSQFSKVLQTAEFGSRSNVRQMLKDKKYYDLLSLCLKALNEVQHSELPAGE